MGTNYYRSPTLNELETRKNRLMSRIRQMELNVESVNNNFRIDGTDQFQNLSPWDEFTDNVKVHLGKRSMGWKFLWNFNEVPVKRRGRIFPCSLTNFNKKSASL